MSASAKSTADLLTSIGEISQQLRAAADLVTPLQLKRDA